MKNKEINEINEILQEIEMKELYRIKFNTYQRNYKKFLYNNDPEYKEKIKKYRHGVPYYQWDAMKRRNEVLDCKVGNLAMIRLLQSRFGVRLQAAPMTKGIDSTEQLMVQEASKKQPANRSPQRSAFTRRSL